MPAGLWERHGGSDDTVTRNSTVVTAEADGVIRRWRAGTRVNGVRNTEADPMGRPET